MSLPRFKPGDRFDMLVIEERVGTKHGRPLFRFRCDCGNAVERIANFLRKDARHSCGCLNGTWQRGKPSAAHRHGQADTPLHMVWCSIKQRCHNPNAKAYHNYGGRGIYVCEEWIGSFEEFARWARGNGYEQGLHIDRIDNDGPYAPWNCRYVTRQINQSNTRTAVLNSYFGEVLTTSAAARKFGIDRATIRRRLALGLSPEQAVTWEGRAMAASAKPTAT